MLWGSYNIGLKVICKMKRSEMEHLQNKIWTNIVTRGFTFHRLNFKKVEAYLATTASPHPHTHMLWGSYNIGLKVICKMKRSEMEHLQNKIWTNIVTRGFTFHRLNGTIWLWTANFCAFSEMFSQCHLEFLITEPVKFWFEKPGP